MAMRYGAPWSRLLVVATVGGSGLLLAATIFICWQVISDAPPGAIILICGLPPLILLGAALSAIRGYTVDANGIFVHRLMWSNQLPWSGLREVEADPAAMRGGIRTFGNGGLFSFSGRYWNRRLGHFRAFVTDAKRAVVLRYEGKTFVISPDEPEAFVSDVRRRLGASGRR